jgi:hypothetical protein
MKSCAVTSFEIGSGSGVSGTVGAGESSFEHDILMNATNASTKNGLLKIVCVNNFIGCHILESFKTNDF